MGNRFYGEGNLGADPELRYTGNSGNDDDAVCNLRIYFDKPVPVEDGSFEDKGGFWLNVEIWGKRAVACSKLLSKGSRVSTEGSLIGKSWQDQNGEERTGLVLRARRINPDLMVVDSIRNNGNKETS